MMEIAAMFARSGHISCAGFFGRAENAKRAVFDECLISPTWQLPNALKASDTVLTGPRVPKLLRMGCRSQIEPAIVARGAIPVVETLRRFLSRHPLPDEAVSAVDDVLKVDVDVAFFATGKAAGWLACKSRVPCLPGFIGWEMPSRAVSPRQTPSLGIIIEALAQIVLRGQNADRMGFGHREPCMLQLLRDAVLLAEGGVSPMVAWV